MIGCLLPVCVKTIGSIQYIGNKTMKPIDIMKTKIANCEINITEASTTIQYELGQINAYKYAIEAFEQDNLVNNDE